MARRCDLTGKGTKTGNNRSHSNRATKRKFYANIQKKRIFDPVTKEFIQVNVSTRAMRTLVKQSKGK